MAFDVKGLYQAEMIYRRSSWRTREEVEWATLRWIHGFNDRGLLEPIGNIPPVEEEANCCSQIPESAMSV